MWGECSNRLHKPTISIETNVTGQDASRTPNIFHWWPYPWEWWRSSLSWVPPSLSNHLYKCIGKAITATAHLNTQVLVYRTFLVRQLNLAWTCLQQGHSTKVGTPSVLVLLSQRRLRWFDHASRLHGDQIPKDVRKWRTCCWFQICRSTTPPLQECTGTYRTRRLATSIQHAERLWSLIVKVESMQWSQVFKSVRRGEETDGRRTQISLYVYLSLVSQDKRMTTKNKIHNPLFPCQGTELHNSSLPFSKPSKKNEFNIVRNWKIFKI